MLSIPDCDLADYKEWSNNFDKRIESFKSDKRRFVKFEDRKIESTLTLENCKGISKGKMSSILLQFRLTKLKCCAQNTVTTTK